MTTDSETDSLQTEPGNPNAQPAFQHSPGETPRAFSAFMTYFRLGHERSHQAVADKLDESLNTIKRWSSKFDWTQRVQNFNAGLLDQQARDLAAAHRRHTVDWADRLYRFREQEWAAAQKLSAAAQCYLESFTDDDLHKMTLAQVSRALKISSAIGRSALAGAELPQYSEPSLSPIQQQFLDAAKRIYGRDSSPSCPSSAACSPSTDTSPNCPPSAASPTGSDASPSCPGSVASPAGRDGPPASPPSTASSPGKDDTINH